MLLAVFYITFLCAIFSNEALDNGLALTPPMGWLSWLRYECNVDCDAKPTECLNEDLILRMADMMKAGTYLDAGYEYIIIDDCWLNKTRGSDGRLQPDAKRFPSGIKALANHVHSKGLKFGIYEDIGTLTCAGYPGVKGHESIDVTTLVSWDVDYLKLDGCYSNPAEMDKAYPAFGKFLNESGRPILYSCSWPAYQESGKVHSNYSAIAKHCNIWRNWNDIGNSWSSVVAVKDWFGDNQDRLFLHAGPGHWHDPDMLVIGNTGLNVDQAQVQMAVWSILAAPLIMSVDLTTIKTEFADILLNRDVIAVNQDKLGLQGLRVWKNRNASEFQRSEVEVWNRRMSEGCYAIAFVNHANQSANVSFTHEEIQIAKQNFIAQDLFNRGREIYLNAKDNITVYINKTGVKFYKLIPL